MKKNIKKLNDDLAITNEIWEIFSNKNFLEVLVNFLNDYSKLLETWKDFENEIKVIDSFLHTIINENWIKNSININEVYLFVYDYFSYWNRFNSFLGYVNNKFLSKEEKESKSFSPIFRIMDYLYSKLPESTSFNDEYVLDIFLNQLKTKIEDILLDWFDNAMFELAVNDFSPYTEKWNPIKKADFEKTFTFWKELYVSIEYYDENLILKKALINKKWKFKRSRKGVIISSIEYAFSFWKYNFMKLIDDYNSHEIELVSGKNLTLEWMKLRDVKVWKLNIWNNTLEYLIAIGEFVLENANTSNFSLIMNKDLESIKISDLQYFLINWELPEKATNKKVSDNLKYFDQKYILSQINKWEYFDWIHFLELTCLIWRKKENLVLTNKWKILSDDKWFIVNINGIENILGFKFLSYWKSHWYLEWLLDKDMQIVNLDLLRWSKIEKIKVFFIKSNMEYKWEKYYEINNDKELIFSETELKEQLGKYNQFEWVTWVFEVKLSDNPVIIWWETYEYVKINKLNDWNFNFNFYDLSNDIKLQKIYWIENFIKLFDTDEFPKQIIKEINLLV